MPKLTTTLPLQGLSVPRCFIWMRGFLHGKLLRSGGLDPETGIISSGYITGQLKRFRNACIVRREQAEATLAKSWADADRLLFDLAAIHPTKPGVPAVARANGRSSAIRKELSDIANAILTESNACRDQMEATAEKLLSTFAAYGHGLLMEPVHPHLLPTVTCEDCAAQILRSHADTWDAMQAALKEGK